MLKDYVAKIKGKLAQLRIYVNEISSALPHFWGITLFKKETC